MVTSANIFPNGRQQGSYHHHYHHHVPSLSSSSPPSSLSPSLSSSSFQHGVQNPPSLREGQDQFMSKEVAFFKQRDEVDKPTQQLQ